MIVPYHEYSVPVFTRRTVLYFLARGQQFIGFNLHKSFKRVV